MKKYKEKNKQNKLIEIMRNEKQISFKVLQQLEVDGIIEDYDLFRVISDHFNDMYIFYLDENYYLINRNKQDFRQIDNSLLQDRYFLLSKCITNNIQGFIQKYGMEAFNELSTKDFINILLNNSRSLLNAGEER